jgi:hypothetical protein
MNTQTLRQSPEKRRWASWLLLLALGCALVLVAGVFAIVLNERGAALDVQAELDRIRAEGLPTDDASMERWFRERTFAEGTVAWNEILRLASTSTLGYPDDEQLPVLGTAEIPQDLEPGGAWPEEAAVAEYLDYVSPVLDLIEQASQYPAPVWQPIAFQGWNTLLEQLGASRSLMRILTLEVEQAVYHGDSARAMRGLRLMRAVLDAFQWDFCLVVELTGVAQQGMHHATIRRTLAANVWDARQLETLLDQIGPAHDPAPVWRNNMAGERAMTMGGSYDLRTMLDGEVEGIALVELTFPSVRKQLLEIWRQVTELGNGDLSKLAARAKEFEDNRRDLAYQLTPSPRAAYLMFPAIHSIALNYERAQDTRRFARTCVAVKLFQLRHRSWPKSLGDLTQVGLSAADWNTVNRGTLGYGVEGDCAYVWYVPTQQDGAVVPVSRPKLDTATDRENTDRWLTVIR